MKYYADSSFLVKLISNEPGTEAAVAEFRRAGCPRLPFNPLHDLEVNNAILQRVFYMRRTLAASERAAIQRDKQAAQAKLGRLLNRGAFAAAPSGWEEALPRALELAHKYTEQTGARAYDLFHVAAALVLEAEVFLTTDERQMRIARGEGLTVVFTAIGQ